MKTVQFSPRGGTLQFRLKSGYMQPAVFSLFLWAKNDSTPRDLGGGVLLDGHPTTVSPPLQAKDYKDKIVQAVVTVSLVNGKRYAPEIQLLQDGVEIGSDEVDKTTTRHSIGVQFLFLMQAV
jgi:hypothetical protein